MSSVSVNKSVALVTGSNRGIGKALVEALLEKGASKVYAAARQPDTLKGLAEDHPGRLIPIKLDVTNEEEIAEAVKIGQDVNILINNAGVLGYAAAIGGADTNWARAEMEVNYFGLLNLSRAFAPILAKNGGGALVNLSSIAGLVSIPMLGTYCATKAAVHSITGSIRAELAAQGTRVTGVYPGPIDTDMADKVEADKESPEKVADRILSGIEHGVDDVFPDKMSEDTAQGLREDPEAVKRQFAEWIHQPEEV